LLLVAAMVAYYFLRLRPRSGYEEMA